MGGEARRDPGRRLSQLSSLTHCSGGENKNAFQGRTTGSRFPRLDRADHTQPVWRGVCGCRAGQTNRKGTALSKVRTIQLVSAAIAVGALLGSAPASAQGVKIGILDDQSGVYADFGGKWSVGAAKMAIEDFGGSVLGRKIELVDADHQNKVDLATAIARR